MQTRGVDFVGYTVTDIDRSVAFYRDKLNLKPGDHGDGWAEFDLNNVTLSIFVSSQEETTSPPRGGGAVALAVPDVDAAVAELRAKDVPIVMDKMASPVCDTAVIADPDGNRIYLHRRYDGTAG
jgi:catechol 2,3-dioxygenase-like lactoylglutathione lyase family enzyme